MSPKSFPLTKLLKPFLLKYRYDCTTLTRKLTQINYNPLVCHYTQTKQTSNVFANVHYCVIVP